MTERRTAGTLRVYVSMSSDGFIAGRDDVFVIGEAERFRELAAAWYARGPAAAYERFAQWFKVLRARGLLRVDDLDLAAQHVNWLVLSIPLNEAMARLPEKPADRHELNRGLRHSCAPGASHRALGKDRPAAPPSLRVGSAVTC